VPQSIGPVRYFPRTRARLLIAPLPVERVGVPARPHPAPDGQVQPGLFAEFAVGVGQGPCPRRASRELTLAVNLGSDTAIGRTTVFVMPAVVGSCQPNALPPSRE
jgi:hypothetical protein